MEIYVVKPGDSVDSIAALYGIMPSDIIYINQLLPPYPLAIGQALLLPPEAGAPVSYRPSLVSNGYAYTYISQWVLEQTLPFLTSLSVFSYGFTTEGDLVFPPLDDNRLVQTALQYGVKPILTLTPLDASGQFNNNLITAVVRSQTATDNLLRQLLAVMEMKGYVGIDIDFEYIRAEDRDLFTAFVRAAADYFQPRGYSVSVALAPKTSANQRGLLYEGKDYGALGSIADYVLLMTYEWGYKYGPNMAVAPLNMVRRVVEYAVTEIPPDKIHLGIPNYGYDWPLPYVSGETAAVTIGNVEAVQIAIRNNAPILFDETAQSPYFRYTQNNIDHEVWFEDVRSIQRKCDLVKEFGLQGMGYWQIMRWWRANWLLLEENFEILA